MKLFIGVIVAFFFAGCSLSSNYVQNIEKKITIISNGVPIELPIAKKPTYKLSGCIAESFFIEQDEYQIEYIRLHSSCTWTGLADGMYQDFLRRNIKNIQKTATFKVDNGDIYRFETNGKYFYLVSLFDATSNIFIIDYTGQIVSKIMDKNFSINFKNQFYPKLQKEFLENYMFKGYFERQRSKEDIIFP